MSVSICNKELRSTVEDATWIVTALEISLPRDPKPALYKILRRVVNTGDNQEIVKAMNCSESFS